MVANGLIQRLVLLLAVVSLLGGSARAADPAATAAFFRDKVAPLLVGRCLECHGAEGKGGLDLRSREGALRGGESGDAIVPGKAEESLVFEHVSSKHMPPKKPLAEAEVAVIKQWIAEGAFYPEQPLDPLAITTDRRAGYDWWSLQPLKAVEARTTAGAPPEWQAGFIDRFVAAKLAEQKLAPSPAADPRALIRRATYDLTGLPPSPAEVAAFLAECQKETGSDGRVGEQAYAALVDRLLASPRYGQQWGRHWLDVVRFGESNGFERNVIIDNVWPFRDYVIRSLNDDKPFKTFVYEHLAGDRLAADHDDMKHRETAVGTAFLVCGPYDNVGNQDAVQAAQIRANTIDEMVTAVSNAFLGLTVGCSRCHDHKFDPISQRDYYALYATFAGVQHGARPILQASGEQTPWWVGNFQQVNGPFNVFLGGSPERRGDAVTPGAIASLAPAAGKYELAADSPEHSRRSALAAWLIKENPLTLRVLANRIWQYHFGTGIVDTPNDLGFMGGRPTHPELLDTLAAELVRGDWRLKPLHRTIMLSQTYRQAAAFRAEAAKVDADSRLLWRYPPRRLSAEEIRDTMLAVAGKLDLQMGGPGFRLFKYVQDNVATYHPLDQHGPETYRRAVYHHRARAMQIDLLSEFDLPDCAFSAPKRSATTTPLQANTLLNHQFTLDMARFWAERIAAEAGADPPAQVKRAFELALLRAPSDAELADAEKLVRAHGLRALCRAMLNANELIYLE